MSRKVETEFAYDIGDVVRMRAWEFTNIKGWSQWGGKYAPDAPTCVYQIVELLVQICEGGLQRKYSGRPISEGGHSTRDYFTFVESEIELAEKLPQMPKDTANFTETKGQ